MHVRKRSLVFFVVSIAVSVLLGIPAPTIQAQQQRSLCTAARTDISDDLTATITLPEIATRVIDITHWEDQQMVWIVSLPPEMNQTAYYIPHDVQLRHHVLDLATGDVTAIDYPYADIVTPELTDALGITAEVFGADSRHNMLMVAPERDKVLYLRYDATVEEPCCGDAYQPYALWSANSDGSDQRYLELARQPDYLRRVDWYGKHALLTFNDLFGGGNTPFEVCLDESCSVGRLDIQTADKTIQIPVGAASISPDGQTVVLTSTPISTSIYIQDHQTHEQRELAVGIDHALLAPVWETDSQSFYFLNNIHVMHYDLTASPADALTFVTSTVQRSELFVSKWLFLPDYGAVIVVENDKPGLTVQCYGTYIAPAG